MNLDLNSVTMADLDALVSKTIADFCNTGFVAPAIHHCAHLVAHVLSIDVGVCCGQLVKKSKSKGVTVRVSEIFNGCPERGPWSDRNTSRNAHMICVTPITNVTRTTFIMGDNPKRHIGIAMGGYVWHYANQQDMVVKMSTDVFEAYFKKNYGANAALFHCYREGY